MLTYSRSTGGTLTVVDHFMEGCWIRLSAPTPAELAQVSRDTGLALDLLQYPLDPDERPRVERDGSHVLIVVQTPKRLPEGSDIPYDTVPLGILHTDHCLVTVCTAENLVVDDVVRGVVNRVQTTKRNRLTLQLLLRTAQRFLIDLRRIDRQIEGVQDQLENATRNRELLALMKLEKSLVYFTTALKANALMIERLKRDRIFQVFEEDSDLLDDVLIENLQAIEMTGISTNILTSTLGTFASIIANNVSAVVRLLTVSTILVAIPTMVTSIFGMNVPLPNQEDPRMMGVILLLALGLSTTAALIFRWMRWF